MSRQLRVPGHTLLYEGAPHSETGQVRVHLNGFITRGGQGRAKCSCGQMSEVLASSIQRQQWHRDHKHQIISDQVLEEIKQSGSFEEWRDKNFGIKP